MSANSAAEINFIRQSTEDSWFQVKLNDVEMLLPRNTLMTMRHCVIPRDHGPIEICVETGRLRWMISRLTKAKLFLDVGAATGAVTLPIAITHPAVRVLAFEPARRARELLSSTLRRNGIETVEVVTSAVSDVAGQTTFSEYKLDATGQPPFLPETSAIHHNLIDLSLVASQYEVITTTLDNFRAQN